MGYGALPWAMVGDSITYGVGATATANQWSYKVAAARGVVEMNFGQGSSAVTFENGLGAGWAASLQTRYQDILALDFGKVLICYGGNDCVQDSSANGDATKIATYVAGYTPILQAFAARYGAANVFAISPQWHQGKNTTHQQAWNAGMAAAAAAAGVTFIDYYSVLMAQATPASFCLDNTHPNDSGHNLWATTVLAYV
jgi:lysophospholipase L1-like esterase